MKTTNFIFGSFAMIAAGLTLMGCGSQSMKESSTALNGLNGNQTGVISTPIPTGNVYGLPGAPQQRVTLGGNNSTAYTQTLTFQTSRTLKIKIKPLPAPNITVPGYTNWVFPYGCVSVTVTVNGMTRGTQTLRVEGVAQGQTSQCANAPTSQTLDFTDVMTGTGTTQVVFGNANYDNCRQYWPLNYGCSMSAIWQEHKVALDTTVQVDGTWMDP